MIKPHSTSFLAIVWFGLIAIILNQTVVGQESNPVTVNQNKGHYTILIVHNGENIEPLVNRIVPLVKATENCSSLISEIRNPGLRALFRDLRLDPDTAPTPLAIALAPNNVVTGIFTKPPSPEAFRKAILPQQALAIRKALADGKTVIVKMQSSRTSGNSQTDKGLHDFFIHRKNQKQYIALPLDLHASENDSFIRQLGFEPNKESASLLVALAPPLTIVNTSFRGAATRADLEKLVTPCACAPGTICR